MSHKGNLEISGMKGCQPFAGFGLNNHMALATRSHRQIAARCKTEGDSFFQLFNFSGFDVIERGCGTPSKRKPFDPRNQLRCLKPTPLFTSFRDNGWWGCDRPAACEQMIARLVGANESVACVGTINEYFLRGMLKQCQHHRIARKMSRHGLPLNQGLAARLEGMMPPAERCTCFYARLNDEYKNPTELLRLLNRSLGKELSEEGGARRLEIVSSCEPFDECQERLRQVYGDRLMLHTQRSGVASVTDLTPANGFMAYDIYRCARCPTMMHASKVDACPPCSHGRIHAHGILDPQWATRVQPGKFEGQLPKGTCGFCEASNSYSSSFFHAVDLLHSRWHGVPNHPKLAREI